MSVKGWAPLRDHVMASGPSQPDLEFIREFGASMAKARRDLDQLNARDMRRRVRDLEDRLSQATRPAVQETPPEQPMNTTTTVRVPADGDLHRSPDEVDWLIGGWRANGWSRA